MIRLSSLEHSLSYVSAPTAFWLRWAVTGLVEHLDRVLFAMGPNQAE